MKPFRIFHWDTFDNVTLFIDERDTFDEAEALVQERYKGRIAIEGADIVEIVTDKGAVVKMYRVK